MLLIAFFYASFSLVAHIVCDASPTPLSKQDRLSDLRPIRDHVLAAVFALTTTVCSDATSLYAAHSGHGLGTIPFLPTLLAHRHTRIPTNNHELCQSSGPR